MAKGNNSIQISKSEYSAAVRAYLKFSPDVLVTEGFSTVILWSESEAALKKVLSIVLDEYVAYPMMYN